MTEDFTTEGSITESSTWTTENPTTPCHPVSPIPTRQSESQGSEPYKSHIHCENSIMVVEKIKSEYDSHRVATSVLLDDGGLNKLDLDNYIEDLDVIRRYGFNHIIIVRERDYGLLFLDCFGRIFDWDSMNDLIWP